MPKMPVVNARDCIKALQKAGFYIARQKGSHITLRRDDPKGRVTVPNHNPIKPGMLNRIIKDAGLTLQQFIDLLLYSQIPAAAGRTAPDRENLPPRKTAGAAHLQRGNRFSPARDGRRYCARRHRLQSD